MILFINKQNECHISIIFVVRDVALWCAFHYNMFIKIWSQQEPFCYSDKTVVIFIQHFQVYTYCFLISFNGNTFIWEMELYFLDFGDTDIWTQAFELPKLILFYLSRFSSPFFCDYFGYRVSFFVKSSLDCDLPILHFSSQLGWQVYDIMSSFFSLLGCSHTSIYFLLKLAWNCYT
jgi:hypothetical protein